MQYLNVSVNSSNDVHFALPSNSHIFFGTQKLNPRLVVTPTEMKITGQLQASNILIGGTPVSDAIPGATIVDQWTTLDNSNVVLMNSNVGIGTPVPSSTLNVVGTTEIDGNIILPNSLPGTFTSIKISSDTTTSNIEKTIAITSPWSETETSVYTINQKVGIKTDSPQYTLDVVGDINVNGNLYQNGQVYQVQSVWTSQGSNVFITGSNIGIGKSNPTYNLDVDGDIYLTGNLRQNGTVFTTGSQWISGTGASVYISSNLAIGKSNTTNGAAVDIVGNLTMGGDIIPRADLTTNIGDSNRRIKDMWVETIYLGSNTLYLGDTPILGTNQDTVNISADVDQGITIRTTGTGVTTVTSTSGIDMHASGLNAQVQIQSTGTGGRVSIGSTSNVAITAPTFQITGNTAIVGDVNTMGNVTINGNLTVAGGTFAANVQTMEVQDNILVLNKGQTGSGVSRGTAGISIDRGTAVAQDVVFDEASTSFKIGPSNALSAIISRNYVASNFIYRSSNLSDLNDIASVRSSLGLGTSCNVTFATVSATSLSQGGVALSNLYAPITVSNVAYSAYNRALSVSAPVEVAIAASNRAFTSLPLSGGTISGTLNTTTLNASNVLQQGGVGVSSLYAPIETSNVAYLTSNVAYSIASQPLTTVSFSSNSSNIYLGSGSNLGLGGKTNPAYPLDVVGDINISGSLRRGGVIDSEFSQFSVVESNVYINSNFRIGIGLSNPQSALQVAGHITPGVNLAYDLGSSNMRWRDLFLSGNTINIASTKLSIDNSNNLTVRSARDNKLRKIVVDEIQIGTGNSNDAIVMRADDQGAVRFFRKNNDVIDEIVDDTGVVNTAISLSSNLSPTFTTSNSYVANAVSVPTLTTSFVPSTANLSFGRIRINGHNGVALSNGGEITLSVAHNLGTSNYMVFSTPENARLQVSFCNFLSNSFVAVVRNESGGIIANPVVNYMLVKSPIYAQSTSILASPVNLPYTECNISLYSSPTLSNTTFTISGVTDPQNYPISYAITSNVSGRFSLSESNLLYTYGKLSSQVSAVINPKNPYNSNSYMTFNFTETFIDVIGLSNTYNINISTSNTGQLLSYNLPQSDQGLNLLYEYSSNVGAYSNSNIVLNSNVISYYSKGITGSFNIYMLARFAPDIMSATNLNAKSFDIQVNETYIPPPTTWVAKQSGSGVDQALTCVTTNDGGCLVSGHFTGDLFKPYNMNGSEFSTQYFTSSLKDIYIVKYSSSGMVEWINKLSGTNNEEPSSINKFSDDSFVISGFYNNSVLTAYNPDGSPFETQLPTSTSDQCFIVKYNSQGYPLWITRIGPTQTRSNSTAYAPSYDLCVLSNDEFVISVNKSSSATNLIAYNADSTQFNTQIINNLNMACFIKYNNLGYAQWICRTGTNGIVNRISATLDGFYVAGSGATTMFNANGTQFNTVLSSTSISFYIAKISNSGIVQWNAKMEHPIGTGFANINAMSSVDDGVIIGGYLPKDAGTLTIFNANRSTAFTISNADSINGSHSYIIKYNSNGQAIFRSRIWLANNITSIATNADRSFYVVFHNVATLTTYNANNTLTKSILLYESPAFNVVKYDSSGNPTSKWISITGSTYGNCISSTINDNVVYISGIFNTRLRIYNPSGTYFGTQLTSTNHDAYLIKYVFT